MLPTISAGTLFLACCASGSGDATIAPQNDIAAPRADNLHLPDGFVAYRYAQGFEEPTAIELAPDGMLWLSERGGRIIALPDTNDDLVAEPRTFAENFDLQELLGIAVDEDDVVYASSRGRISVITDDDGDGDADSIDDIVTDLPNGRHQNNNIVLGRDERLYFGNGSTCNLCDDESEMSGAILSVKPNGDDLRVFATGLRNPYGIIFSADGNLYVTDNGPDPPDIQGAPDELNRIVEGDDYGWPDCIGGQELEAGACEESTPPLALLQQRSSSDGLATYDAEDFPEEYRHAAFIAQWGPTSEDIDAGRRVVYVQVREEVPQERVFATGFDRPIDVAADLEGRLYVADFATGIVYVIVYEGA
ncbi:MAG TPA: PQQ-dependent sugar dehydrogenase [Dehalococcoidia bacterium]|nr:PQQ-dependent sugar dehydrogenase [Dehalococcoidia bacterium]